MLLKLIEDLHTVTSAWVKSGQHLSPRFVIFSGVRKGCVLPPDLICAAIDFIMEHVSHKCGISVGNAWFSDLNYADDVMLFAERQEIGLHILWAKTTMQLS